MNAMTDGGDIELTPRTKGGCPATKCHILPDIRGKSRIHRLESTVNNITDVDDIELAPRETILKYLLTKVVNSSGYPDTPVEAYCECHDGWG